MLRAHRCKIIDLMTAARAGRDHDGVGRLPQHLFDQRNGDLQGESIFCLEHAESAGHAAAAGLEEHGLSTRQPLRQLHHEAGMEE